MDGVILRIAANGIIEQGQWPSIKSVFIKQIRDNTWHFENGGAAENEELAWTIKRLEEEFQEYPPYTIQRVAELAAHPREHYKDMGKYLRALNRSLSVSSTTNDFLLSSSQVECSYIGTFALGSDDENSPALLSPIPWATAVLPTLEVVSQGELIRSEQENGLVVVPDELDKIQAEGPSDMTVADLGPLPTNTEGNGRMDPRENHTQIAVNGDQDREMSD